MRRTLFWWRLCWRPWSLRRRRGRETTWRTKGKRRDLEVSIPDLYTVLTSEASIPEVHAVLASEAKGEEVEDKHGRSETLDSSLLDVHTVLRQEPTLEDEEDEARDESTGGLEADRLAEEVSPAYR
jgi:hypothetical protein